MMTGAQTLQGRGEPVRAARTLTGSDWTFDDLAFIDRACQRHAARYRLDCYPNEMQVITSEQMLDAYSSIALPVHYHHWSFGKHFVADQRAYLGGQQNLAYEIVLNSNPCVSYLMEQNSLAMQALVIAHACYGHNSFFKGNYLFKTWTQPDAIVDYMVFARAYVAECEERHGYARVEETLDALHALQAFGVDKYKRPGKLDLKRERKEQERRMHAAKEAMRQSEYYSLVPQPNGLAVRKPPADFPAEPCENVLYFIEKNAPKLEPWQRELCRIVRKVATYFQPQRQLQIMNEGWATFFHHRLLHDMHDADEIDGGILLEAMHSHTNVIRQGAYQGINPYALGFAIYTDIKRICEQPTAEDRAHCPQIAGSDWLDTLHDAMANYRDESFLLQFLSPKVVRDLRLMTIRTDAEMDHWQVTDTAGGERFEAIRSELAASRRVESYLPDISVTRYRRDTDRALFLRHTLHDGKQLDAETARQTLGHLQALWGYDVHLETVDAEGTVLATASA